MQSYLLKPIGKARFPGKSLRTSIGCNGHPVGTNPEKTGIFNNSSTHVLLYGKNFYF
ncbi:MAG: hypothetical protein ACJ749_00225 [Flavisolibacter sp.]